jgi:hypothetical protein
MFFLQQNQRTRGQNRFCPEAGSGRGGGPNTCVSKYENDKVKFKK